MTLWDACGNRLLVVIEPASDARLRAASDIAGRCFSGQERIADGIAWFAPRGDHFRTAFFNPDGTAERLCGNSLLIAAAALADGAPATVHPFDHAPVEVHSSARVQASATIALEKFVRGESAAGPVLDTGSPHVVVQHDDVTGADLEELARPLIASLGVNVTLYTLVGDVATVRTFERGVNAETLACGTGALAVAFAVERALEVRYPGGTYMARAERTARDVRWSLSAPAHRVRRCSG